MASHFDSVHAESTDLPRAATCTCDKQTACVLVLCAARHLSLCHATPARVRFRSPTGRVRSYKQRGFFGNYLLVLLIPHLLLCEIPLHTLLIYCRDVHTFVEAQVFISGNFCLPNACRFWLLLAPFDLETVFREQFTPFVQLLFPNESLLGTSVKQDFFRVESPECPGSAEKERSSFRRPCYSDEPLLSFPQVSPHVDRTSSLRCPRFPSGH